MLVALSVLESISHSSRLSIQYSVPRIGDWPLVPSDFCRVSLHPPNAIDLAYSVSVRSYQKTMQIFPFSDLPDFFQNHHPIH